MKKQWHDRLFSLVICLPMVIVIFLILVSFSIAAAHYPVQSPVKIIVVMESTDIPQYNEAVQGFKEVLKKQPLVTDIKVVEVNLKREARKADIIDSIKAQQPALILTVGTANSTYIPDKIKDIPIVFTMVLGPPETGITTRNIVGASLDVPAKVQLETLKSVVPQLKKVGVIYHPPENSRFINEAKPAASQLGLVLNAYPVNSARDIPILKELNIDVLWIIPDGVVCQETILRRILLSNLREGTPIMGFNRSFARVGALLAIVCDYKDIGRQSGELAARILKGENYSRLEITQPRNIKLYLNQTTARLLGIHIPKKILQKAEEVFGK